MEVWIEHLSDKRPDLSIAVVRDIETGSKWFPTVAEFMVGYKAKLEYERISGSNERGLPSPSYQSSKEAHESGVAACRAALGRSA